MPPSFNLIDEPFLPCLRSDGAASEYGLRDVLTHAHEIAELRDGSPLVTVALHRLLLAVLHRVYDGPAKQAARVAILTAKRFDVVKVSKYLEHWRDRFGLFDDKEPFYQSAGFKTAEPSPVNRLAQELARGNNAALFDHTTDDPPPAFTPAAAARVLIAEQAYAVGGGKSDTGNSTNAPLVAGAVVLACGDTLFDTLCYNLTRYDAGQPIPWNGDDKPIWEAARKKKTHEQSPEPSGYLDYLTWQARSLRLHPEEVEGRVVVRRVSYAQGRAFAPAGNFFDPMKAYRKDDKLGLLPVRFTEHKALWRDSSALFQFAEKDQYRGPTTLQTLGQIPADVLPRTARYRVSTFGLCTDKAKVNFWRHEGLPLPLRYLDDARAVELLQQALALAETVGKEALRWAAWAAASEILSNHDGSSPDKDRVSKMIDALAPERRYWCEIERPFRQYMVEFASGDKSLSDWFFAVVRPAALDAFETTFGRLGVKWDLKAVTDSRRKLKGFLTKVQKTHHIETLTPKGSAA